MVLVDIRHSSPLDRSFSHPYSRHDDDPYDHYLHRPFAYRQSISPPQQFSMDRANHPEQDKNPSSTSPWRNMRQAGNPLVYAGSDLGDSSVPQSSNGSGSISGLYMAGWDTGSVDAGSHRGSLTESQAAPGSLRGSFAGSVDGSSPSFSRTHRPSQLNLEHSNHFHQPASLPMLTSQLALQTPGGVSSTPPELLSSTTSQSRQSASSFRESEYVPSASSSSAGPSTAAYLPARHSALDPRVVLQRPQQPLPVQAQLHPTMRYVVGPTSEGQWSEAYLNNAQISIAMRPPGQPYPLIDNNKYPRDSVDGPPWGYQNIGTQQVPVNLSPPGVTPVSGGVGMYPAVQQPADFYYPQPAPPAFFLTVPPVVSPSPLSRTSTPASSSRSKGRKKMAIGRVRLPGAHSRSISPALAHGQPENPWERMQQASSLSGAFTHSGVYGLEPSDGRVPFWAPQQPQIPRPTGPYDMTAQSENATVLSTMGYYAPNTAELYQRGSVSIPATVATTHVALPNTHMIPPAMVMNPSAGMQEMSKSSLTAGTPASLCNSTFSSVDDDADGLQHPGVVISGSSRMPSGSSMHSRAPGNPYQPDQTSEEDEHEELQDVREVYPGLSDAERSGYDGKATSAEDHSGQSNTLGTNKRKSLRRSINMPLDPVNMMDFSRYMARSPRLKLPIACQGCRDKKLKCSGERPMCVNCKRRGLEVCEYAETIRRRGPGRKKLAAMEKKAKNQPRRGLGEDNGGRQDEAN